MSFCKLNAFKGIVHSEGRPCYVELCIVIVVIVAVSIVSWFDVTVALDAYFNASYIRKVKAFCRIS